MSQALVEREGATWAKSYLTKANPFSEKAMAPHSSALAWKLLWMEEPGRLQSTGSLSRTRQRLHFHFLLSCIGEGNGNPVQCSCLEDPRDGGAWWAAFSEVTQSRTRLKWLSNKNPFMLKCKCLQLEIVRSSHKDYPFRPLFAWKVRFRLWLRLKKNNMCHMKLFWHDNTWNN